MQPAFYQLLVGFQLVTGLFLNLPTNDDEMWMMIARGMFHEADGGTIKHDWGAGLLKPLTNLRLIFQSFQGLPLVVLRAALSDILSEATLTCYANGDTDIAVGHRSRRLLCANLI
jgi:hypothetical protein